MLDTFANTELGFKWRHISRVNLYHGCSQWLRDVEQCKSPQVADNRIRSTLATVSQIRNGWL